MVPLCLLQISAASHYRHKEHSMFLQTNISNIQSSVITVSPITRRRRPCLLTFLRSKGSSGVMSPKGPLPLRTIQRFSEIRYLLVMCPFQCFNYLKDVYVLHPFPQKRKIFFVDISSFIVLFFMQYVILQAVDVIGHPSKW